MMLDRRQWMLLCGAATLGHPVLAQSFDHSHAAWSRLLQQHVVVQRGGRASQVRYAGLLAQRSELQHYLRQLSAVSRPGFESFSRAQQMAFLINAYNAFTVELILTRYPRLESIKDLGNFLSSPWKQRWITLLGETVSLDDIEHGMLRKRGVYDDPRIHFAVNCASIGCPMLREEAYVPERLDAQLDAQMQRFMSDRERNRWNPQAKRLELSRIFDWYAEDFRLGHQGIFSLHGLASRFANVLADSETDRARILSSQVLITYLDYDWRLNDAKAAP
jgi:hypothetical protein